MSQPPPLKVPDKLTEDAEVELFMDDLLQSLYLIWSGIEKNVGFYGNPPVAKGAALTTALTDITHTTPTPDYAIQNLTTTTPFGFVTANEGNTVLSVIANLQTRVNELEARLNSATGIGVIS